MSRGTVVIVGKGASGKTAELIERSAESGIYILVANRKRAEMLVKQAKDMKLYIPFPVTLEEWLRSDNRFHGSSIRHDGLLIDDIDDVIKELFLPIEIKAVTLRTPSEVTNLDHNRDDVVEVRHGHWIERIEKPSWLEDDVEVYYDCSECGTSHWSIMPPYCPECGAKMDGERKEV